MKIFWRWVARKVREAEKDENIHAFIRDKNIELSVSILDLIQNIKTTERVSTDAAMQKIINMGIIAGRDLPSRCVVDRLLKNHDFNHHNRAQGHNRTDYQNNQNTFQGEQ